MEQTTYKISADEYSQDLASALALYSTERNSSGLLQMLDHQFLHKNTHSEVSLLLLQMMQNKRPDLKAELGRYFRYGNGVHENQEIARKLYSAAMKSNSKTALVNMAWSVYEDHEYIKVIELVEDLLKYKDEIADESLLADAYSLLGDSYSRIENPDYDKSIDILTYCAERYHDGYSYYRLSVLYAQDIEDIKDIEKSVRYLKKAVDYELPTAMFVLAEAYTYGDTKREIKISYEDAKKTIQPMINSNNFEHIRRLIGIYYQSAQFGDGDGDSDFRMAVKLYDKLVTLYDEGNPKYAEDWPRIHNYVGRSLMCIQEYERAAALLKKAYEAGIDVFSDFYAYLLQNKLDRPHSEYLPIYKEHYNKYQGFSNDLMEVEYLSAAYSNGWYEDCLKTSVDYYEKEKDILYCEYISKIVLYDLAKCDKRLSVLDVIDLATGAYMYIAEQDEDESSSMTKIVFANALGHYYSKTGSLWKAVNWYLKSDACDDAEAALALGRIHERTVGTFKADSNAAYKWYVRAGNLGSEAGKKEAACFKKVFLRGMVRSS